MNAILFLDDRKNFLLIRISERDFVENRAGTSSNRAGTSNRARDEFTKN